MHRMKVKTRKSLVLCVFSLLVIAGIGLALALQWKTLVEWWKPALICVLPAFAAGFLLARCIRAAYGGMGILLSRAAGVVLAFSVFLCSFYALNYFKSDSASAEVVCARVASKHSEEEYQMRRIGRNRYVRGQKQMVYSLVIKLPDGAVRKIRVPVGEYVKTRVGRKVDVLIEKGLFGIPVIKDIDCPVRK